MKRFSSKHIALKTDVTGPENILFAGTSCIFQPGNVTGWGSEGVNNVEVRHYTEEECWTQVHIIIKFYDPPQHQLAVRSKAVATEDRA